MSTQPLYFERQDASLCAVHALNSLLQGPYFSAVDLLQLAQELDATERALMSESGVSNPAFLKYMAEDSGNVAADGNFSLAVIEKCLETWNLQLLRVTDISQEVNTDDSEGYICNLGEHWIALRKMNSTWYNFDSLKKKPEKLSDFYFYTFLEGLRVAHYDVFRVVGPLPVPLRESQLGAASSNGKWINVQENENTSTTNNQDQDEDDLLLQQAIAASLE